MAPSILVSVAVAAWWYIRGFRDRRRSGRAGSIEALSVFSGLAVILLALNTPIDPLGERSYFMHQIQHLLLRSVAPLLIFVASPAPSFVAGLPKPLRRTMGCLVGGGVLSSLLGVLFFHPAAVTLLFIAAAWIWQWPPYFTIALHDDAVHYAMHFTMLGTGMLFWWRVFDDRPSGPGYGTRIVMLWGATVSNIILGAMLTLKGGVVYPAYDALGRLWLDAAADEVVGGIIVWIPGAQMALIGLLVVIRRWGRRENRGAARSSRTGAARGDSASAVGTSSRATAAGIRRQALALGLLSAGIVAAFASWIGLALTGGP